MRIPSARILKRNLNNFNIYARAFPQNQHSTLYEYICTQAMARILKVPFFTAAEDSTNSENKVIWNGTVMPFDRAHGNLADSTMYACNFNAIFEITRKTRANQWVQEGAQLTRHNQDMIQREGWDPDNTYSIFLALELHRDTFEQLHRRRDIEEKIIMLNYETFIKMLDVAILPYSFRHLELRNFFGELMRIADEEANIRGYKEAINRYTNRWVASVLNNEKETFLALKGYKKMSEMEGRFVSHGDIINELRKDSNVLRYFNIIDKTLTPNLVADCMINQGLAVCINEMYDRLLTPVPKEDFCQRISHVINKVQEI